MSAEAKITIIVNKKPFHVEGDEVTPEQLRELAKAPNDYEVWRIIGDPDPEGQLPTNDIQVTGPQKVKSGDRFRVVPPGTFGIAIALPGSLAAEIADLRDDGIAVEILEETDYAILILTDWVLPPGYNKGRTRLLLRIPRSYPLGKPDMFWVERDLRLANGQSPRKTSGEQVLGTEWLRFSWHPGKWDPALDGLRTYLAFVEDGLSRARF